MSQTNVIDENTFREIAAHEVKPQIPLNYDPVDFSFNMFKSAAGRLNTTQYVWDSGGLVWVPMTQPTGGGGGGGAVTIADGADVVEGTTADAAITTDSAGTVSGKLRGLIKILASVWDSANGRLKVDGSAVTQPVSGTFWQATQPVSGTVSIAPDTYSAKAGTASASGDTTVHTPAAGKAVRLHYLCLNADGANSADVTALVKFAAGGAAKYKLSLKAGAMFARNIGAGRRYIQGAADEVLMVNLSAAQAVNYSFEYEEI